MRAPRTLRSRALLNLALLIVSAGLVGVLVLDPWQAPVEVQRRLTTLDAATVGHVRIEPRDGDAFELARSGDGWTLVGPHNLPAAPHRVQALLGVLATTSRSGFRAAGNDLAEFGLEPPKMRLIVDGEALAFGDTDAIAGRRYVLFDGEVHLVNDLQYAHLGARAENFVYPSPLGPDVEVTALELPGLELWYADGSWRTRPARADLGADDLRGVVDAWHNARALRVGAYDPALEWGETVRIGLRSRAEPVEVLVATRDHEVVLGRPELALQWHFVRSVGERLLARD